MHNLKPHASDKLSLAWKFLTESEGTMFGNVPDCHKMFVTVNLIKLFNDLRYAERGHFKEANKWKVSKTKAIHNSEPESNGKTRKGSMSCYVVLETLRKMILLPDNCFLI